MSNQRKTLPEVLGEYTRRDAARFHMPGHKGRGLPLDIGWDVTELADTDDLHSPEGCILQTELKYKRAYGSRHSFLLVSGGTAGVVCMQLALGEGKRLLMARDCHRSAVSGAALSGHQLQFVYPEPGGMVTPEAVSQKLDEFPADAVLVTSPDYYGRCADLCGIARAAHSHGALLLVDAAHGAHFPFSAALPELPARELDMWCTSAHKTLSALTQTAVLHLGHRCPIGIERIRRTLSLIESSSPSYLLMSSLDWALHSATGWDAHIKRIRSLRKKIASLNGLSLPSGLEQGVKDRDITRLVINVNGRGISGKEAAQALSLRGVEVEMADLSSLVLITTPNDPNEWYTRLFAALSELPYGTREFPEMSAVFPAGERVLDVRQAVLCQSEQIPLEDAAGRIAAQAAGVYPPGVAALFPGELIRQETAEQLLSLERDGLTLFGITDGCACCVRQDLDI